MIAFNPSDNSSTNFAGNEISLISPGGPAPNGGTNFPYRIIAGVNTAQAGTGTYTPSGSTTPVTVYGPMTYDPKTKFVLVANAGSNTLTSMSLDPNHTFQKAHIQDLQLPAYELPGFEQPCYLLRGTRGAAETGIADSFEDLQLYGPDEAVHAAGCATRQGGDNPAAGTGLQHDD